MTVTVDMTYQVEVLAVKGEKIGTFPEVGVSNSIVFRVFNFFSANKFLFSKNIRSGK